MQGFRFTKLEEGEEIVFGPYVSSSQSNLSVRRSNQPTHATHTSVRIVCVTDRRLIIETGDSALTIPTKDIQSVVIKRHAGKVGPHTFEILRVKSKNGHPIQLDIPDLKASREADLATTFPNAKVKES
ncbi:MAG: hypothetical protein IH859_08040, partial [Chloroflexi bacterium]|nr:hypothetical protein [Chloroflexota bacterium]